MDKNHLLPSNAFPDAFCVLLKWSSCWCPVRDPKPTLMASVLKTQSSFDQVCESFLTGNLRKICMHWLVIAPVSWSYLSSVRCDDSPSLLLLTPLCCVFFQATVLSWERTTCSGSTTQSRREPKGRRRRRQKPPWSPWTGPSLSESFWRSRELT